MSTEPVQPVHASVDEALLTALPLAVNANTSGVKASASAETAAMDTANALPLVNGAPLDPAKMKTDTSYLLTSLRFMYDRAKGYFLAQQYPAAEYWYRQVFQYAPYVRLSSGSYTSNLGIALFEFAWLTEILRGRLEARKILSQALLPVLDATLQRKEPALLAVRETITDLQQRQLLPSSGHLLIQPPVRELDALAKQLVGLAEPGLASEFYQMVEVAHLLESYRARRLAMEQMQQQVLPPGADPRWLDPLGFQRKGVPMVANMPQTQEMAIRVSDKSLHPEQRPDRIEPIHALSADTPTGQGKQRQKQQQKKKPKLERPPKPPISF